MTDPTIDIDDIMARYPGQPEYLIFLLQDVQSAYGYISPEAMETICDHCQVPLSQAYAAATFYSSFSLEPRGEHEIKVCLGTACHLKGSGRITENLMREVGLEGEGTTEDLKFSISTVNCLGCCALAPVAVVDEAYEPKIDSAKIKRIVNKLRAE